MKTKNSLESTKKLARITRLVCRIMVWVTAVASVLLCVAVFLAYVLPADSIKPLQESGKLSLFLTNNLYLPSDMLGSIEAFRNYLTALLAGILVGAGIFIAAALQVVGLLKSVEDGSPFEVRNVTRLRKIGVILLIGSVLIPAVTSTAMMVLANANVIELKANSSVDLTLLLCGFLVLILSGVFAYGARLQREHDETV